MLKKGVARPARQGERRGEGRIAATQGRRSDDKKDETKKDAKKDAADGRRSTSTASTSASCRCRSRPGDYSNLQAGAAGQVYYLASPPATSPATAPPAARCSASTSPSARTRRHGRRRRLHDRRRSSQSTHRDRRRRRQAHAASRRLAWSIVDGWRDVRPGPQAARRRGELNLDAVEVKIDPRAEWQQIFDEAWRINRDYFYDPNMHGADWNAMQDQVRAVPARTCTSRGDLYRVIRWMLSELAVGHSYTTPGERLVRAEDGPRRPARRRLRDRRRPLSLQEGLRRPELDAGPARAADRAGRRRQGGRVPAGGQRQGTQGRREVYSLFEGTAGKSIEITVGPSADGKGSRTVTVEPIASEFALRNRDWVEGNLTKVHEATNGRVAYVYVPEHGGSGTRLLQALLLPAGRQGRDHRRRALQRRRAGRGLLHRPPAPAAAPRYWATRYGETFRTPGAAILGPKVMLIDETAGSGGDLLPWMFREYKLGPLVGKRTWGGLVGILGFPTLMDGGNVTAPNLAFWTARKAMASRTSASHPISRSRSRPGRLHRRQGPAT